MSKKNLKHVKASSSDRLKSPQGESSINKIKHPVFCFKYLHSAYDLTQCSRNERLYFLKKLVSFSQMTWAEIQHSPKHGRGSEKINQTSLSAPIPPHITKDVVFLALRFHEKKPFIGYRTECIFHIVFIDPKMKAYKH